MNRICKHWDCNHRLIQRDNEHKSAFKVRKFCSLSCAGKYNNFYTKGARQKMGAVGISNMAFKKFAL